MSAATIWSAAQSPALATIYDVRAAGKLKLSSKQRARVRRINQRSARDRNRVLRKHGINPNDRYPLLEKIVKAAGELEAIGRRTRLEMSKVLEPAQMRIYDQLVSETRARVRKAVMSPPRVRRLKERKKREQAEFDARQRRRSRGRADQ
ncbi:MAG: hypothetical protein AAF441_15045 [Pseudomonadota bacterium]